ncbi:phosphorylase [Trinickia terrae]|uniref:Phosphorylase n=1 Tax=Trinickia terrae TaxID=2571161 RepID=A0A4U1IFM8_9BURK|nr:phosphorylase [Trinickia terrae]TKC92539.1 phosphorylase [Trinickia terrae]
MNSTRLLQPGTLGPAIEKQTSHALHCGALQPIASDERTIDDAGVRFIVRQVSSLARKNAAKTAPAARTVASVPVNPFLPHDPNLFVADISETHFALLNKFNVIDHHLLIVTRSFIPQDTPLDAADFAAWLACLAEFDGLGFYNSCTEAGASQPHKHLQIVPLPLGAAGLRLPIEPLVAAAQWRGAIGTLPGLPFRHAFAALDPAAGDSPEAAHAAADHYRALLEAVTGPRPNSASDAHGETPRPAPSRPAPYNLLITSHWMLLVPRSAQSVESVEVNALGFAGSLFVRDASQMQVVERLGPMNVLRRVAMPADETR